MELIEDLDEEQESTKSREEEEIVANLYFIANIISEEETEILDFELELSYKDLLKDYDELWMIPKHLLLTMLL